MMAIDTDARWVLYGKIPKPGMERKFREIEKAFKELTYHPRISQQDKEYGEAEYRRVLATISLTPKDFDEKFDSKDGIVDGGRINRCVLLPAPLRARALNEQTAIEAIDYGTKMTNAVRYLREVRTKDTIDNSFTFERDLNFIQNTAHWLLTWGKRGFGYFVLR